MGHFFLFYTSTQEDYQHKSWTVEGWLSILVGRNYPFREIFSLLLRRIITGLYIR